MTRRGAILALLLIVLAGLALRVWYASFGLHQGRFWDERYALANVQPIVFEGTLLKLESSFYPSPVFNLPPAALLAASDALYRASGDRRFAIWGEDGFTATAYLLVRLLQAVYGTLAIILTYWIGRRLFSPAAALVAAAAIAFAPWMIHSSGYFKPDALLLFTLALAFVLSLRAVERPGTGRYLAVGAAIALALSAKLTGGFVAVPLVVGTLWGSWREPRRWLRLGAAGAATLVVFFAVNPYGRWYLDLLGILERDYAMRAGWEGMTRWSVPAKVVTLLTGPNVHGPLLGAASLGALVVMAAILLRRTDTSPPGRRAEWAMLLVFPPIYVLAYAVETPYFKANNFIPVMLVTSLALGWGTVAGHRWLSRRFAWLALPAVRTVLALGLVTLLALPGYLYVYRGVVPTTVEVALGTLSARLGNPVGRLVWAEASAEDRSEFDDPLSQGQRLAAARVRDLGAVDPVHLELADAVLFPSKRASAPMSLYHSLAGESTVLEVPFRPLRVRGRSLMVSVRNWRPRGSLPLKLSACPDASACWQSALPSVVRKREYVSAIVFVPAALTPQGSDPPALEVGGRLLPLVWTRWSWDGHVLTSPRFRPVKKPLRVRLDETALAAGASSPATAAPTIEIHRWRRARRPLGAARDGHQQRGSGR